MSKECDVSPTQLNRVIERLWQLVNDENARAPHRLCQLLCSRPKVTSFPLRSLLVGGFVCRTRSVEKSGGKREKESKATK